MAERYGNGGGASDRSDRLPQLRGSPEKYIGQQNDRQIGTSE
jgi:hypothetical protein